MGQKIGKCGGVLNNGSELTSGLQTPGEDGKVEGEAFMTDNQEKNEKGLWL